MDLNENSEQLTDDQIDAIEQGQEAPAPQPESGAQQPEEAVVAPDSNGSQEGLQEAATTEPQELVTIKYKGEEKQIPKDQMVRGYQQIYDLDQRYKQFKTEQEQFTEQQRQVETQQQQLQELRQLDEYAKANPEWLRHWQQAFQNRDTYNIKAALESGELDQNTAQAIQATMQQNQTLSEQIGQLQGQVQQFAQYLKTQEQKQADEQLDTQINTVKESYPTIGWDQVDDNGISVMDKVIKYAADNSIPSVKAAAFDLMGDDLLKAAEEKGKREAIETLKKQKAEGIVGIAPSGAKRQVDTNIKPRNYEEAESLALNDIKNMTGG